MKKTIDWDITGTWLANKWKLNITYIDGSKETIIDTISNLMKKTKTLC